MPTRQNRKLEDFIHWETRKKTHSMPDWNSEWTGGSKPIARSTKKQHLLLCIADWFYWQVQRDLLQAWHWGRGTSSLKVILNTIYSRDLAYLSWKLQGVEGWDGDRFQIKRSPCLRFFTKRRFSIKRTASCSLRPSCWPLLTRWFTQTGGLQSMIFSCSVCECQVNIQSKLVVFRGGKLDDCSVRLFVDDALHWEESTEPFLIFIQSRQMNNQKHRDKWVNKKKNKKNPKQLACLMLTKRPFPHHIRSLKVLGRKKTPPQLYAQSSDSDCPCTTSFGKKKILGFGMLPKKGQGPWDVS